MKKLKADFERASACPHCGHKIDSGQVGPSDPDQMAKPKEGDLGVCIECAGFMIYTDTRGSLRKMTPEDLAALSPELLNELVNIRLAIHTFPPHEKRD